ncbi:MAG: HipA domain-containing protein [Gammaproteobacteria bacterium]|nr:HipA domain-containing protein [Gammaproteobacteria bacterium]
MKCQICLKELDEQSDPGYHSNCIKRLFGDPKVPTRLKYPRKEFREEVRKAVKEGRMSISGVQPKAQMTLESPVGPLVVTKSGGEYILKPTPEDYPCAAINEHLSMQMAKVAGFDVPECGLLTFADTDEQAYVIRRFDRIGDEKLHHEDMMQVFNFNNTNSDAKYDAATYLDVLNKCTEIAGLGVALECFSRLIFNYLTGNDDFHLKNISVMHGKTIKLTQMYDCLNSEIYSGNLDGSLALSMTGNDEKLPYYGTRLNGFYALPDFLTLAEMARIKEKPARRSIARIVQLQNNFIEMVYVSNLDENLKEKYSAIIKQRVELLSLEIS